MKNWLLSGIAICLLAFCLPGSAQTPNENSTPNSNQTGSQNGNAKQNDEPMEGCIVHQGSYYFLQPQQGAPVRLQWSNPISKNEGHQVRIEAHHSSPSQQETVMNNGTSPHRSVNNGPAGDRAATSKTAREGDFIVDSLHVISATCPGGTKPK